LTPSIFFVAFFAVFTFQVYVVKKYLIARLKISKLASRLAYGVLYGSFALTLAYPLARYAPLVPNWLYFLLSIGIGVIFLAFSFTLLYTLLCRLASSVNDPTKREMLKKSTDVASLLLIGSTTLRSLYNAQHIEFEEVSVALKDLAKPYTIAQLSDVHIGGAIGVSFIAKMVDMLNQKDVDLVVITGDLVDTKLEYSKSAIDELARLKSRFGTYFVVGNHEYFHGVECIVNYLEGIGIKVLKNENLLIDSAFNLAGVYDLFGYRYGKFEPDLYRALEGKKDGVPTILLAHQPKFIKEVEALGGVDLLLSGHTHGGQIVPFNFLVKLEQPYISGLHRHTEELQIYVSKGTGFWGPPMRLGSSSEISIIRLKPI